MRVCAYTWCTRCHADRAINQQRWRTAGLPSLRTWNIGRDFSTATWGTATGRPKSPRDPPAWWSSTRPRLATGSVARWTWAFRLARCTSRLLCTATVGRRRVNTITESSGDGTGGRHYFAEPSRKRAGTMEAHISRRVPLENVPTEPGETGVSGGMSDEWTYFSRTAHNATIKSDRYRDDKRLESRTEVISLPTVTPLRLVNTFHSRVSFAVEIFMFSFTWYARSDEQSSTDGLDRSVLLRTHPHSGGFRKGSRGLPPPHQLYTRSFNNCVFTFVNLKYFLILSWNKKLKLSLVKRLISNHINVFTTFYEK